MIKYTLYPIFLILALTGINLIEKGMSKSAFLLLVGSITLMFIIESLNMYEQSWKATKETLKRDVLHFLTNHSLLLISLAGISYLQLNGLALQLWPKTLNFYGQVLLAIFILDFGITITHYYSHKSDILWKFHEPHHSLQGLYGFNGLMKHPVHQALESLMGVLPLLLLGVPTSILHAVTFCVSIQLLLQHSNVDYTVGPLRAFLAVAENHRFHHVKGPKGNVNFGLFFTIWDRLLGTAYFEKNVKIQEVGLFDEYPQQFKKQLTEPFIRIWKKTKAHSHFFKRRR